MKLLDKRHFRSTITAAIMMLIGVAFIFSDVSLTFADPRGRPKIEGNTLVSEQGTRLRGGTFWIYGWISSKTTWALSPDAWKAIKDNNFNAMRVACGYRVDKEGNYTLEQYDKILDSLFYLADLNGIYLIIDFHDTPGSYNMASAKEFWTRYSKRYKDKNNAIFELTNEPVFDQPNSYTANNLRDFEELWKICNDAAPATPIIILTYCQVGYSKALPEQVADSLRGIDWKKTAVGFHSYWRDSSTRIVGLKKKYPCINTEFMCQVEGSNEMKVMDGYAYHGTLMEKLGISWLQWDILDRPQSVTEKLPGVIADLKTNDVFWEKDSVYNPPTGMVPKPRQIRIFNEQQGTARIKLPGFANRWGVNDRSCFMLDGRTIQGIGINRSIPVVVLE